jgi:hypothetical protein
MSNLENDEQSHLDGESIVPDARAGFWRRVASFLVDQALLVSINLLLRTSLAEAGDALALAIIASYYTLLVGSRRGQTLYGALLFVWITPRFSRPPTTMEGADTVSTPCSRPPTGCVITTAIRRP